MSITPFLYPSIIEDQLSQLTFVIFSVPPHKCYENTLNLVTLSNPLLLNHPVT